MNEFWLVIGSQSLYGEETLKRVERDCAAIADALNEALPCKVVYKDTVKTCEGATQLIKAANFDDDCAGIITFCHTFSPSKMWINGLSLLQKPWCHLHTQFNREIPNDEIDMDYMNLHQSAHGDREHGFIGTRMRLGRKVIAGYWGDGATQRRLGQWQRAAVGAAVSRTLKVMRFGDNMREVAVTEGDKVGAQIKFGWQVNTFPVGALVETMSRVTESEVDGLMSEYAAKYAFHTDDVDAVRYQAREEIAIKTMLDSENCRAFSNTFQDLYGMRQLPGLATQDLLSKGYGYGGEGDWKVSAMTAIVKSMGGDASFMEDYTYDLGNGLSLGSHMLEVCPTLAADTPRIEVHPLGIGNREAPARLVFEGRAGPAVVCSLIDMGTHYRLIAQDVECVKPTQSMPHLPVARVMWKPLPGLETGAECWILAGGAHHTVLSYGIDAEVLRDWARIMDIEFVHIGKGTKVEEFERDLLLSERSWRNA
jgi:L-arabinose isomerase